MPENKKKPKKQKQKNNEPILEEKLSAKQDKKQIPNKQNKETEQSELIKTLNDEINTLKESLKEEKDLALRNLAETENFKKRKIQEAENSRKFAIEGFIKDLLPVIDSLELACLQNSNNDKDSKILEGVELTQKQLYTILDKVGVNVIDTKNQMFDPNKHQSIGQEACTDIKSDTIIREMQKGYMLHDRVIRPSLVVIAE